jgi:hypothetical protein
VEVSQLRSIAVALALSLSAGILGACSSQASTSGQAADLPAAGGSAYQSAYAYDPDSLGPVGMRPDYGYGPLAKLLAPNETYGFGDNELLVFRYHQQFDCVVGPDSDVDSIGKPADKAPEQFSSPECVIGIPSHLAPSGRTLAQTDPLYILVPFFETNKKTGAFTPGLGKALEKLFGFIPDAFKPDPGVAVQCPAPLDKPSTCTMHPLQINLGPVLVALGKLPKGTNLYVPLVNHDHLLNNGTINQPSEWWTLVVVLVEDPKAWPDATGSTGITSLKKLREAQAKKEASADVPSNFFLYFSSYVRHNGAGRMPGMNM